MAKGENVIRKWAGKLKDTKSLDIFASVKGIFGWRLSSPCGPAKRQANSESEKCHKRTLKQDLVQNAMVLINGSLAIVFADRYGQQRSIYCCIFPFICYTCLKGKLLDTLQVGHFYQPRSGMVLRWLTSISFFSGTFYSHFFSNFSHLSISEPQFQISKPVLTP